ncbi:MAG TPA: hypothetical protein VGI96_34070 [Streptosporangiaceae bacterium]
MRFFRHARSPGHKAGERSDRVRDLPVTDSGPGPGATDAVPDPPAADSVPGRAAADSVPGRAVTDSVSGRAVTDPGLPGQLAAAFADPPGRPRPDALDVLTLREVTTYFAGQRPGDPRVRAGALLAVPDPGGRQVFQVFLDAADRLCADASGAPYGRRILVRRLDDDLLDYLGGGNLLIFR